MLLITFFCPEQLLMNAFKQADYYRQKYHSYFLMEDASKMNVLTLLYFTSQWQLRNKTFISIFIAPHLILLTQQWSTFLFFLGVRGKGARKVKMYASSHPYFSDSSFRRKKMHPHIFSILRITIRFNQLRAVQQQAHLNTVMNFQVPQYLGNFLTISASTGT